MKDFDFERLEYIATRFNPLPTRDKFLDRRYEWQRDVNGVEWPYYRFFYHLSKMLRPGLVLELGTYQGTAAAHFAAGMHHVHWEKAVDLGVVIAIDHHSDLGDDNNQMKVLAAQDIYSNLVYYQGWTTDNLAEIQKGKHARGDVNSAYQKVVDHTCYYGKGIDILFIDSWHCYEYAREDWETYKSLLNSPALVICDDIQEGGGPESPIQGMMQFWEEMPEPKFLNSNLHPDPKNDKRMGFVKYE